MDKKQFYQRLKEIYHHTKHGEHNSSFKDVSDALINEVVAKSNGGWDESVAATAIKFAEHIFKVQPNETRAASLVKSSDAETELGRFLTDRGYTYTHIPEGNDRSPDGYIERAGTKYLCEVKSPTLMFDHKSAPFGYKHATTHRKILDAIHEAKKQLDKHDPEHTLPHILAYTSALPQLDYTTFIDAIRGYRTTEDGKIETDLRKTKIFQETNDIINNIDLYIFFRIGSDKQFIRVVYFDSRRSAHAKAINKLINHLKSNPISSMDGHVSI